MEGVICGNNLRQLAAASDLFPEPENSVTARRKSSDGSWEAHLSVVEKRCRKLQALDGHQSYGLEKSCS